MHPHLLLHVSRLCRFAGISGQYPLVQNVTVTEGGIANLTCRVEFNDNTSLQWSNPAQQTLFFGDKKGELEMKQTTATTWQIWSLKVYVGFAEECIKRDWILFFFFCWLEIDLKKTKNRTFSVCLSLLCLSICPTFLEFVFSCLCSTFFHSKEKQIHLCPSCFSCCFLQSFPLWMYSMPLLLLFYFVTVHPYTHR